MFAAVLRWHVVSKFFLLIIILGIPINILANQSYDSIWNIGDWLISYAGGFVRRGLPGSVLHMLASTWQLNPILLISMLSVGSYVVLLALVWWFCRNKFDASILLSPIFLLAPVIGGYLLRKDVFLVALYGLSLLTLQSYQRVSRARHVFLVPLNLLSMLAIFSHESYGFWGLPSLVLLIAWIDSRSSCFDWRPLVRSSLYTIPSILAFLLCLMMKGSAAHALLIHQSWQDLSALLPSTSALQAASPIGAIGAIKWSTAFGMSFPRSTLTLFSGIVWVPAAWMLTIYVCFNVFVGAGDQEHLRLRRFLVLFQFLVISPLFFLGFDFGRWIFLWIGTSVLLYGFLVSNPGCELFTGADSRFAAVVKAIAPGIELRGRLKYGLLLIGIPHCCWGVLGFARSTSIGYAYTLFREYLKIFHVSSLG